MNLQDLYNPSNCDTVLTYVKQCCNNTEAGRIREALLVHKSYQGTLVQQMIAAAADVNLENAALFAGILAGKIVVIPKVRGTYDGGSAQESPGFGDQATMVTGKTHTVELSDANIVGNFDFADAAINADSYVLWFTTEKLLFNTHVPCSINVAMPIEEALTSQVMFKYTVKWDTRLMPRPYWRPSLIFDCTAFSAAISLELFTQFVDPDPASADFKAKFESACPTATTGAITLEKVLYNDGDDITDVTADFTLATTTIAAGNTEKAFSVTKATALAVGEYTFTFGVTGCGRTTQQLVDTPVIVSA